MTREDRILFACARQELLPRHRRTVEGLAAGGTVDWEGLAATAERHGVAPIVGANLLRCDAAGLGIPAETARRLETAAFENALRKELDAERLATGLTLLREAGLEAMLLKGTALDLLVYEEPWVTASRDIDLLLRPLPHWQPGEEEKRVRRSLYRSGIECDLGQHHDMDMNGVLPVSFESVWKDARPVRFRGIEAWVMGPEDLLISLCINSCRKRFLRLKGLFDIAESVRRLAGLDWDRLAERARSYRCEGIVYAALFITASTVGCDLPEGVLDRLGVNSLRARLLRLLAASALRSTSLTEIGPGGAVGPRGTSLVLPYASFRWRQAWQSLCFAIAHPEVHGPRHRPAADPISVADQAA
jgi:Uncharacterised nucleotidyltransferase